ncbi:hypothetical protein ABIE18_000228 [Arthrobacter sp. 2762]
MVRLGDYSLPAGSAFQRPRALGSPSAVGRSLTSRPLWQDVLSHPAPFGRMFSHIPRLLNVVRPALRPSE